MFSFLQPAARWVGRHSFPAVAATVLVVGAAGSGIGYSIASQHAAAAPLASTTPSASQSPTTGKTHHHGAAANRGQALIARALGMLAKETGQSVASIRAQLAAGKSIDDIAGAKASAIEAKILSALTKLGDRAVKAGKITAAQESTYLALAKSKVTALMAEPGTQLMQDVQRFLQMLGTHQHAAWAPAPTTG